MKYIGPFLRMNSLNKANIESQLLFFSRESFKHLILNSRCGITTSLHQLKLKNIPNFDINIFKKNSPLLCIYKKANPKLTVEKESYSWDESTFKKEIIVTSNAYMSLMLLDTYEYYDKFKDIDNKLFALSKIYSQLSTKQLDFFSSNLRNSEGVFVDKKDCSDGIEDKILLEDKSNKFKFSDQALLMCAYYKASLLPNNSDAEAYKDFSLDILNMFLQCKDELYNLSLEEINKLCFAVNLFYDSCKGDNSMNLLIDLCDLLIDKYYDKEINSSNKIENTCMMFVNMHSAYNNLSILKFKDEKEKVFIEIDSLYDSEKGIFLKKSDKKDIDFSSQDIVLYTLCHLSYSKSRSDYSETDLINVYKRQLVNSGIILSWPDSPTLDNPERYRNFSLKSEDLLEDCYFKMPTTTTPENTEMAPVFIKSISYNIKKDSFEAGKATFDSAKNMSLLYMIQYLLK